MFGKIRICLRADSGCHRQLTTKIDGAFQGSFALRIAAVVGGNGFIVAALPLEGMNRTSPKS